MNHFKGTPGEWNKCGASNGECHCGLVWSIASDFPVATVHNKHDEIGEISVEQWQANMNLIAAAPDLLEALQNLVQLKEWKDRNGKDEHYEKAQPIAWNAARAAILKALNQEV